MAVWASSRAHQVAKRDEIGDPADLTDVALEMGLLVTPEPLSDVRPPLERAEGIRKRCRSTAPTYPGDVTASDPKCWLNPDSPALMLG
jgi:hypothetical protein